MSRKSRQNPQPEADISARRDTIVSVLAEAIVEAAMRGSATPYPPDSCAAGAIPHVPLGDLIFLRDRASLSTEGEQR